MMKLSAWLAVGVSIPLAVSQLVRNWDNMDRWWTWGVDELVAVLLAIAGVMVLRGRSSRFLAPAWSFATALYMSSLATHLFSLDHAPTAIIGYPYTSRHDNAVPTIREEDDLFPVSASFCAAG